MDFRIIPKYKFLKNQIREIRKELVAMGILFVDFQSCLTTFLWSFSINLDIRYAMGID